MVPWTFVQSCGAVGVACAAWNLFGDLYYMDFYTVHLSDQEMGMLREDQQAGYLFQFNSSNWWIGWIAQSGGWMYPIWAFVTVVPLHIGLKNKGEEEGGSAVSSFWKQVAPCALLAYGLCIIGGALHNAFSFLTVLPSIYHHPPEDASNGWSDLVGTKQFSLFLKTAQTRILQHIMVGCFPGYIACNVAGLWVAGLVQFGDTKLPKRFNFFNPVVTMCWVQILGAILPDPWGFYLVGCLGTWGLLVFNAGTTYYLWNEEEGLEEQSLSSHLLSRPKGDYRTMQQHGIT